jgi:hypothetical protein
MYTVHQIPGERKCRRLLHEIVFGSPLGCPTCGALLLERADYCWCKACRKKIRVKAATWLKGSRLSARTLFLLLFAWQQRATPGDTVKLLGLSYPTVSRWFERFRIHLPSDTTLLAGVVEMTVNLKKYFTTRFKYNSNFLLSVLKGANLIPSIYPDPQSGTGGFGMGGFGGGGFGGGGLGGMMGGGMMGGGLGGLGGGMMGGMMGGGFGGGGFGTGGFF